MHLFQTFDLDIIAITETSHKSDNFFTSNVSLTGFKGFYTPSNSINGGTALYVKDIMKHLKEMILKAKMIILKVFGLK